MTTVRDAVARSRVERREAGRWATIGRVVVGLGFIAAAVFNTVITYPGATAAYEAFAELSWPVFDVFVREVVIPLARPVTAAVIVFEFVTGTLVLSRGRWTRLGIAAAVGWHVVLIPFLSVYAIVNVVLAAAIAVLLRYDYPPRTDGQVHGGRAGAVRRRP